MVCVSALLLSAIWSLLLCSVLAEEPTITPTSVPSKRPNTASPLTLAPTRVPTTAAPSAPLDKIYTAAGVGTTSYSGDGTSATSAGIKGPLGIVVDSSGNFYVSDQNHRVRKITLSTGIISTYVGTGTGSYSGDNGIASSATINSPYGLGMDSSENIYIADSANHRIRKLTVSTSIITTIAGTGNTGTVAQVTATDGSSATSALLFSPQGVAVDTSGNINM